MKNFQTIYLLSLAASFGCVADPQVAVELPPSSRPPHFNPPAHSDRSTIESFGLQHESDVPPPAISGGTLALTPDHTIAIASDPDRDRVWIASVNPRENLGFVQLYQHDEPGRVVADDAGRAHVVLRGGGAVVSIDIERAEVIARRDVCESPRGIALDPASGTLHVACQSGRLISMASTGGPIIREFQLPDDLRDVVIDGDDLWVSRFRSAEVLLVDREGNYETFTIPTAPPRTPSVAWRMVRDPTTRGVAILHQMSSVEELQLEPSGPDQSGGPLNQNLGAYGGDSSNFLDCSDSAPLIANVVTFLTRHTAATTKHLGRTVLAVDLATRDSLFGVAAAGSVGQRDGGHAFQRLPNGEVECALRGEMLPQRGSEMIAVAFDELGHLIGQVREPPGLVFANGLVLSFKAEGRPPVSRIHFGHALFHRDAGAGIACASCHPEGSDDGRVWTFSGIGGRRTQSMRVGIAGTEPLHWDGDMRSFDMLAGEVFSHRMLGPELDHTQTGMFQRWIESIRPFPTRAPADPLAAVRGRDLFADTNVGCMICHAGTSFTNNTTVDVGTDGHFQVPSLVGISRRAPFMHDGCAEKLRDRFDPRCGGDRHGNIEQLSEDNISDLIAYLETL